MASGFQRSSFTFEPCPGSLYAIPAEAEDTLNRIISQVITLINERLDDGIPLGAAFGMSYTVLEINMDQDGFMALFANLEEIIMIPSPR